MTVERMNVTGRLLLAPAVLLLPGLATAAFGQAAVPVVPMVENTRAIGEGLHKMGESLARLLDLSWPWALGLVGLLVVSRLVTRSARKRSRR